jgi:Glu-tRNA(Gln) amidotransferase subunit E-like FAD-binding protein
METKLTKCKIRPEKKELERNVFVFFCLSHISSASNKEYLPLICLLNSSLEELNSPEHFSKDNRRLFYFGKGKENALLVFSSPQSYSNMNEKTTSNQSPTNSNKTVAEDIKLITDPAVKKQESGTLENEDIKSAFKRLNKYMNSADTPEILTEIKHHTLKFWSKLAEIERLNKLLTDEFGNAMDEIEKKREKLLKQKKNQSATQNRYKLDLGLNKVGIENSRTYEKENEKNPNANNS